MQANKLLRIEQTKHLKALGYGPSHAELPIHKFSGPLWPLPYELDPVCPYEFNIPTVPRAAFRNIDLASSSSSNSGNLDVNSLRSAVCFGRRGVGGVGCVCPEREVRMLEHVACCTAGAAVSRPRDRWHRRAEQLS